MEWDFTSYEPDGSTEHLHEHFYGDGTGQVSLALDTIASGSGQPAPPDAGINLIHQNRQIFLSLYRNISVTDNELADTNYSWWQDLGSFSVAGMPCDRYVLDSVFGIGDAEILVDQQTGLILSWKLFDPAGDPLMEMDAAFVNYQPDFGSVVWAVPQVASQPYDPWTSDAIMGFEPLRLVYGGPGFNLDAQSMLLTNAQFPEINNLHLNMLTDGLRTVFVAQQEPPEWVPQSKVYRMSSLSHARSGGVSILEGLISGNWVFCVGSIPVDDLVVLASSLKK